MKNKIRQLIDDPRVLTYTLIFSLVSISIYFINRLSYFYVPDTDFIQYLDEGRELFLNPFAKVVTPPLYSIIFFIFEKFLPLQNPGITGGIILNIFAFVISIFFLFRVIRPHLRIFVLLPIGLWLFHPLTQIVNLQPLNIPLATLFIIVAIFTHEKYTKLSYLFSLLAFFCRPESIALNIAFVLWDFITVRNIKYKWLLMCLFIIASIWFLRPFFGLKGNDYMAEMAARKTEIPNINYIQRSLIDVPFLIPSSPLLLFGIVIWLGVGSFYTIKAKKIQAIFIFYCLFYSLFHIFFPANTDRYIYPILPFLYIQLYWPYFEKDFIPLGTIKKMLLLVPIILTIFIFVMYLKTDYLILNKWDKAEKRLTAEWFNSYAQQKTTVYMFEPWVAKYYSRNKFVYYAFTSIPDVWSPTLCEDDADIFVVLDSQTNEDGKYYDYNHGLQFFKDILNSENKLSALTLVTHEEKEGRWSKIYKLDKKSSAWCN